MRGKAVALALLLAAPSLYASTFTVSNSDGSGTGSLRWAINRANGHAGDDTITFDGTLRGAIIAPATAFPEITDEGTTLDGDLNDDGKPDVCLNGERVTGGGLRIRAARCTIIGLTLVKFSYCAITLHDADDCEIRSCNLCVNPAGTRETNLDQAVQATECTGLRLGGTSAADRNVIATTGPSTAVFLYECTDCLIAGNYFGINRAGTEALADPDEYPARYAVEIRRGSGNQVGAAGSEARNLFAAAHRSVTLEETSGNTVAGNWFGLAADGSTELDLGMVGVCLQDAERNVVGGDTSGERNVFAGGYYGLMILDTNDAAFPTRANRVRGNWFGYDSTGSLRRRLAVGIRVDTQGSGEPAGAQTIGGANDDEGNWFWGLYGAYPAAIELSHAGDGTVIRNNHFGSMPKLHGPVEPDDLGAGIKVWDAEAQVVDNTFRNCQVAVYARESEANLRIYRNDFRRCEKAVAASDEARLRLGNLGNAGTGDDGGNHFEDISGYFIENNTPRTVKAEGNDFSTTLALVIASKVYDRSDDPACGPVDFIPLLGGVIPGATDRPLQVAAVAAVPTASGTEIAFSLSAPAEITVDILNLAGRPVAIVQRGRLVPAGTQRLLWTGRTETGALAPAGRYLARIAAQDQQGRRATAVAPLTR